LLPPHPEEYNEVWVVLDACNFKDFTEWDDFYSAIKLSLDNNISSTFANKIFEFWLLLHFEDVHKPLKCDEIISALKKYVNYDESPDAWFVELNSRIKAASTRARCGLETHMRDTPNPNKWCSSTNIYALTKKIEEWHHARP
jgi:hypothetical protein